MDSGLILLFQLVAIAAVFYFFIIRPNAKARKRAEEMLAGIKKGDAVTTAGGIVGKVREVKEGLVTIESGTSTLVIERARIVRVGDTTAPGSPS